MDRADNIRNKQCSIVTTQREQPLVRVFLLGTLQLEWQVPPAETEAAWSSRTSARDLFLLLLCMPERQASRSHLAGIMWPESEEKKALESLRSALKVLRRTLQVADGRVLIESVPRSDLLRLAGQEQMWVDLDAFHCLVEQASQQREAEHEQALPLWEHAWKLLRGELLEGEQTREWATCKWAKRQRKRLSIARRRLIRHLATGLLETGRRAQAEKVLSEHVTRFPSDQDAVYRLMKLLIEEECYEEALAYYERCERALAEREQHPAPVLQALNTAVRKLTTSLLMLPSLRQLIAVSPSRGKVINDGLSTVAQSKGLFPDTPALPGDIMEGACVTERDALLMNQQRRHLLQQMLDGISGASLAALIPASASSPLTSVSQEPSGNLVRSNGALTTIDEKTLLRFEKITANCWMLLRFDGLLAVEHLLPTYLPQLATFVQQSSKHREWAAGIVSQGYALAGLVAALNAQGGESAIYCELAVHYARIAKDRNVEAAALKHLATKHLDNGQPLEMLQTYQTILSFIDEVSPLLQGRTYLGLALAYARLGQEHDARYYLDRAYGIFPEHPEEDASFTYADCGISSLNHYTGLIYTAFGQVEKARDTFAEVETLASKMMIPERTRLEIMNCQAEASLTLGDRSIARDLIEKSVIGARKLASDKRYHDAQALYKQARRLWSDDSSIKDLADLFIS